ncbi:MAG: MFS transporter [Thermoanaerobaculia bacterium]|nr:MFS transporter [Thermoanaerobaculia bacterium]
MGSSRGFPPVEKREIFGWAMFDFANSSYTTVVITAIYSGFFTEHIVPPGSKVRDTWWALAIVLSSAAALLLSPLIGSMSDATGRKKRYLMQSAVLCSIATMLLFFVGPGSVLAAVLLIIFSNTAFMVSETLCGSFLPELATQENMAKISGLGWGLGYFGGLASLYLVQLVLTGAKTAEELIGKNQLAMVVTGLFFLLAATPTLVLVKNRTRPRPGFEHAKVGQLVKVTWDEFRHTLETAKRFKVLLQFLLAFTVYMAGIEVVIKFVGIYTSDELGFSASDMAILFLILQISGAAGALGFGALESRLGPKNTVLLTLAWWVAGILSIFFLDSLSSLTGLGSKQLFFGITVVAGSGIGATQSSSRAIVGLLSPPNRSAEMFGFWGLFMRLAAILGMTFGPVSDLIGSRRHALLLVVVFFVVGGLMLARVPIEEGIAKARTEE